MGDCVKWEGVSTWNERCWLGAWWVWLDACWLDPCIVAAVSFATAIACLWNIIPIAVMFVVLLFSWKYIHGVTYFFIVNIQLFLCLTFCHLINNSLRISSSWFNSFCCPLTSTLQYSIFDLMCWLWRFWIQFPLVLIPWHYLLPQLSSICWLMSLKKILWQKHNWFHSLIIICLLFSGSAEIVVVNFLK